MRLSKWPIVAVFCLFAVAAHAQTDDELDADGSSTYDGLVQVKARGFRNVWVKPGVDVSVYSKILPGGAQFHYRDVRPVPNTTVRRATATEFPIEQKNRETIEQIVVDAFRKEAGQSKYFTLTDEPGPDTIFVWGGLYDVVSRVPPDYAGRSDVYLSSVGEATLVVQIEDSMTREVLARVIDRRAAEPAFPQRSSPVTNRSEVSRLAGAWARSFRNSLDKWHDADLSSN